LGDVVNQDNGYIHYSSWLNITEIELNVMTRQCLSRRIKSIELLRNELLVWESKQNNNYAKINWQFKTKDARIKLASLYPELKSGQKRI